MYVCMLGVSTTCHSDTPHCILCTVCVHLYMHLNSVHILWLVCWCSIVSEQILRNMLYRGSEVSSLRSAFSELCWTVWLYVPVLVHPVGVGNALNLLCSSKCYFAMCKCILQLFPLDACLYACIPILSWWIYCLSQWLTVWVAGLNLVVLCMC